MSTYDHDTADSPVGTDLETEYATVLTRIDALDE